MAIHPLPEKESFTLDEIVQAWTPFGFTREKLIDYVIHGRLRLAIRVALASNQIGFLMLAPTDAGAILRLKDGVSVPHRYYRFTQDDKTCVTLHEPVGMGVPLTVEESLHVVSYDGELSKDMLVVPRFERDRFEQEYEIKVVVTVPADSAPAAEDPVLDSEGSPQSRADLVSSYRTPLMVAMFAAIDKFWIDYDPKRPPTKKHDVLPWLHENYEISASMAKAIDTMIRHPDRKAGGNIKIQKPPKG
jgi:hypothetical protein